MSSGTIEYDWTQPEEKVLVDMIRADNFNRPLEVSWIDFGSPEVLTPTTDETYNSAVMVSSTQVAPFSGSLRHRYHRVPITSFVYQGVTDLNFVIEDYQNKNEFAEDLSRRLEINITGDKLLFDFPETSQHVDIQIAPTSLCYYGTVRVFFVNDIVPLDEVIEETQLDGFYEP